MSDQRQPRKQQRAVRVRDISGGIMKSAKGEYLVTLDIEYVPIGKTRPTRLLLSLDEEDAADLAKGLSESIRALPRYRH